MRPQQWLQSEADIGSGRLGFERPNAPLLRVFEGERIFILQRYKADAIARLNLANLPEFRFDDSDGADETAQTGAVAGEDDGIGRQ